MPRLIDDMRCQGARWAKPHFVSPDRREEWASALTHISKNFLLNPDLPVLLIDNVADYYYGSDQEFWDLKKDFPNLAPPFPAFWCESKIPRQIQSRVCGTTNMSAIVPHGRIGVLVCSVDPASVEGEIPKGTKWVLVCQLFIDYGERDVTVTGPHGNMFLCIDAEGAVTDNPLFEPFATGADDKIIMHYFTFLHPAFLAMSFLHCKNVTIVDNVVDRPLAKKYHARTGVRPCVYKTLVIEPLKQILRHEGGTHKHGNIQKALHICRGHFRDYREGRGLFGKYHQLVWMPSILRGTKGKEAPPREIEVKV